MYILLFDMLALRLMILFVVRGGIRYWLGLFVLNFGLSFRGFGSRRCCLVLTSLILFVLIS